jgi:uncharacterized protein
LPYLLEQADGVAHGNDWAQGFMRGVSLREESWRALFHDEETFGLMVPILALFHEHDEDPEMRPDKEPIDAERRDKLIVGAAASVMSIYRYFAADRRMNADVNAMRASSRRPHPKIGRNEPCPCGSGKKNKRCCWNATVH